MGKLFVIEDEERAFDERDYNQRGGYGQRGYDEDKMLEKAFKEGCEHGYKKAMRDMEEYHERGGRMGGRTNYKEGFEEKIEKLKRKYE